MMIVDFRFKNSIHQSTFVTLQSSIKNFALYLPIKYGSIYPKNRQIYEDEAY